MKQHIFSQVNARAFFPIPVSGGGAVTTFNPPIKIVGSNFVDNLGNVLFIRGASYAGYEFASISGFGNPDASGAQAGQANGPNLTAMASAWRMGEVRFPLNSASWFGTTVYDINGNTVNPDPSGTYQAQVITQVAAAVAAGHYVVLDLHWTSIAKVAPLGGQTNFPDSVNGPAFWTSVANVFGYPNGSHANGAVMFELYNEPIIYSGSDLVNGSTVVSYDAQQNGLGSYSNPANIATPPSPGNLFNASIYPYPVTSVVGTFTVGELFTATGGISGRVIYHDTTAHIIYLCSSSISSVTLATLSTGAIITGSTSAAHAATTGASSATLTGHQAMINAVRATGATNPCLISGLNFTSDLSQWLANVVNDPTPAGFVGTWVPQIAAVWHAYPDVSGNFSGPYGTTGAKAYGQPNYGPAAYTNAQAIITAGYPVIITETGGMTGNGTATANNEPFCANIAAWADIYKVTTLFWQWDISGSAEDVCITNAAGAPIVGQGQVQQTWALAHTSRYGT